MNPLEAHKKLLKILPVRTHLAIDDPKPTRGDKRAVIVFGKRYRNMGEAARATGRTRQSIRWRVLHGSDCGYAE